jgi:hypothetical protein
MKKINIIMKHPTLFHSESIYISKSEKAIFSETAIDATFNRGDEVCMKNI